MTQLPPGDDAFGAIDDGRDASRLPLPPSQHHADTALHAEIIKLTEEMRAKRAERLRAPIAPCEPLTVRNLASLP